MRPEASIADARLVYDSQVGRLRITAHATAVVRIKLRATDALCEPLSDIPGETLCRMAQRQIDEYLRGARQAFSIPYELDGSEFQRAMWRQMEAIPYGETLSYGDLAMRWGDIGASQAVGLACGANKLPLVIPCHRVLAKDGLGGFGGGLAMKQQLLRLEAEGSGSCFPIQSSLPFGDASQRD